MNFNIKYVIGFTLRIGGLLMYYSKYPHLYLKDSSCFSILLHIDNEMKANWDEIIKICTLWFVFLTLCVNLPNGRRLYTLIYIKYPFFLGFIVSREKWDEMTIKNWSLSHQTKGLAHERNKNGRVPPLPWNKTKIDNFALHMLTTCIASPWLIFMLKYWSNPSLLWSTLSSCCNI